MPKTIHRFILTIAIACCLCMFTACDAGNEIMEIKLGKLPDRIVYIAGVDKKLDLSGATILMYVKSGDVREDDIYDEYAVDITHNIDFNKPGVYGVEIHRGGAYKFIIPVQVIDKSFLDAYAQDS